MNFAQLFQEDRKEENGKGDDTENVESAINLGE
jgi:hypothetical protein